MKMGRRCSHCGKNGHNSRTCSSPRCVAGGGGLKLFGVQLHVASPIKKSFSMDYLSSCYLASSSPSLSSSSSLSSLVSTDENADKISNGYHSDDLMGRAPERRKGVPWTKEEHRLFLAGLEKLGKGDWRGISRKFVSTRTPTQVASHAQKYFLRQNSINKKKRRSSLFDAVGNYETTVTTLSLNTAAHGVSNHAMINLNSSEQETHLSSYLHMMPTSSPGPALRPPSLMERPHVHLPLLDLELTISSSNSSDHNQPPSSSIRAGTIRVT